MVLDGLQLNPPDHALQRYVVQANEGKLILEGSCEKLKIVLQSCIVHMQKLLECLEGQAQKCANALFNSQQVVQLRVMFPPHAHSAQQGDFGCSG